MNIGVILPHSKLYGGVKRFFELGNLFIKNGHQFVVFNEKGDLPDWFKFNGKITAIKEMPNFEFDALFFTEPKYYDVAANAKATRRIFYFVKSGEKLKPIKDDKRFEIFVNSTNQYEECITKYKIKPFRALGGIDTNLYRPNEFHPRNLHEPFVVLLFGRLNKKRKGTIISVRACELAARINNNIKLILFDTPTDQSAIDAIKAFKCSVDHEFVLNNPYYKNPELFRRAHVFISAERKTGYSNTAAEAMASGIAVIGTKSGTRDFLFHKETGLVVHRNRFSIARAILKLMNNEPMRLALAEAGRQRIERFSWDQLYVTIADELAANLPMVRN